MSETSSAPDLRYPVGRFAPPTTFTSESRKAAVDAIAVLPVRIAAAVAGLSERQIDTPYREGGWTIRQVTHHVADSHLNGYVRFRLALTEDGPTIKPYAESKWAELHDARTAPVDVSIALLDALHARWISLLRSMKPEDFARTAMHPEHQRHLPLDHFAELYAWHSTHHVAHITGLREREGW